MVIIEHLPSRISSRQIPTTSNLRNKKSSNRKKTNGGKEPPSWDLMVKTRSFEQEEQIKQTSWSRDISLRGR